MRRLLLLGVVGALGGALGCQEYLVREKANALAATTPDLIYQQVLDNLAAVLDNPAVLPYFDAPAAGTAQSQHTLQASYTPGWDLVTSGTRATNAFFGRYLLDKQQASVGGSQLSQEAWQITPLFDADRIYLMQVAYREAAGIADPAGDAVLDKYYKMRDRENQPPAPPPSGVKPAAYEGEDPLVQQTAGGQTGSGTRLPSSGPSPLNIGIVHREWGFHRGGWFCVGRKCDVPKEACYVGRHCDTYVWVTPDHYDDLTKFTLAIIDIYNAPVIELPEASPPANKLPSPPPVPASP